MVWAAVAGRAPFLRWTPLVILGDMSYPLYLVHQRIGTIILRAIHAADVSPWIQIGSAVAVTTTLAWAIHQTIEVPGRVWMKAKLSHLTGSADAALPGRGG